MLQPYHIYEISHLYNILLTITLATCSLSSSFASAIDHPPPIKSLIFSDYLHQGGTIRGSRAEYLSQQVLKYKKLLANDENFMKEFRLHRTLKKIPASYNPRQF